MAHGSVAESLHLLLCPVRRGRSTRACYTETWPRGIFHVRCPAPAQPSTAHVTRGGAELPAMDRVMARRPTRRPHGNRAIRASLLAEDAPQGQGSSLVAQHSLCGIYSNIRDVSSHRQAAGRPAACPRRLRARNGDVWTGSPIDTQVAVDRHVPEFLSGTYAHEGGASHMHTKADRVTPAITNHPMGTVELNWCGRCSH
jgi:hypothetical protein